MPIISRFYGILIVMYFNDHNPPTFMPNILDMKQFLVLMGKLLKEKSLKGL